MRSHRTQLSVAFATVVLGIPAAVLAAWTASVTAIDYVEIADQVVIEVEVDDIDEWSKPPTGLEIAVIASTETGDRIEDLASVGKVAIVDSDIEFNIWSPIALVRVSSKCVPRFVYYQLQSSDLGQQIEWFTNSSSQGNIGMGDIEKLVIKLPGKHEQSVIAEILSDIDAEIVGLESKLNKARHLKQGMMQELLTGRIRLI